MSKNPLLKTLSRTFHLFSILLCATVMTHAAAAQTTLTSEPVSEDEITLELESEQWQTARTALIYVSLQAAFDGKDAAEVRRNILSSLEELSKKSEWHITSFSRAPGGAGLEQWTVQAQTRLAESQIDGMRKKIKSKNRPGYQVTLRNVSFTPTAAEKQTTYSKLRQDIYTQVGTELAALKAAFPDRNWRIRRIDFSPSAIHYRRAEALDSRQVKAFSVERAAPAAQNSNMNVSQKVKLHALVVLSSSHRPLQ
ncbi:MAG: hypothetical protein CMF31_05310 [Kordiimonas sp.]|nr:hypothetical protein [Kordiimonas sp.]